MRKLLLATVAVLGGYMGVAPGASAQSPNDQVPSDTAGQTASPAPGTVTVRLNGRFKFYAMAVSDRDTDIPTGKQTNYTFGTFARLYPGFDGVAANGLKYGASLEIRQDNVAGVGGGAVGSISGQNRPRGTLYFRREFGYLGTDQIGTIRVGNTDPPSSLYITGSFENFDGGGLNGDIPGVITGANQIVWPFADVGNNYTPTRVMYLSPQILGFDAGVSFEPNTGNVNINNSCTAGGGSIGCDRESSISGNNAESGRRRNTFDALLRYRGTFGGFGIAATGGYILSSNVKDSTVGIPFVTRANPGTGRYNYDGLDVGDFGAAVTYGGLSVGGKYQFGRFNGQWSLAPKGTPDGEAFLFGASYTIGPVIFGAHYLNYKSGGDAQSALRGRERTEQGIAVGATYSLAPGVSLFASYVGTERKQNGYNFVTGVSPSLANPGGDPNHNKVTAQVFGVGTGFSW